MAALLRTVPSAHDPIDTQIAALLNGDDGEPAPAAVGREVGREVGQSLRKLIAAGLDRIPPPGNGATLKRWQCLAQVARHDLALVKLYESHTDALAIFQEIDTRHVPRPGVAYAVWASESRVSPLKIRACAEPVHARIEESSFVMLDGRKAWCSGARVVDMGLVTACDDAGGRWLAEVDMRAGGVSIDESAWNAVGMRDSASFDVIFDGVPARIVGHVNGYLDRPGFWYGGAGVAACWFGAAAAIGTAVRDLQRGRDDPHALAHLGAIDCALASGASLLRECAAEIDAAVDAVGDFGRRALRVRSAIADIAESVIHHAARAVGPGPLCNDPHLARLVADLPIFIRQCRAEHDLVAQSRALLADAREMREIGWLL